MLSKKPTFDQEMMQVASEINKSCPFMIDAGTRLDNSIAIPPKTLQYNYTLVSMEKETADIAGMIDYLEPLLVNLVRTNPDMKYLRGKDAIINYSYKDKHGVHMFTISITPQKYK